MTGVDAGLADASNVAKEWVDAWNSHDLARIMTHYSADVIFESPMVVQLGASMTGTLCGAHSLGRYFAEALTRCPDLRFELLEVMRGIGSLVIVYRNQAGRVAAEVMTLREGVVAHGSAHYGRSLAS